MQVISKRVHGNVRYPLFNSGIALRFIRYEISCFSKNIVFFPGILRLFPKAFPFKEVKGDFPQVDNIG